MFQVDYLKDMSMKCFSKQLQEKIQWKSMIKNKPYPIEQIDTEVIHHLDYIQSFYNERHR